MPICGLLRNLNKVILRATSSANWLSFPNTINIALLLLRVFHLEVNRQPSSPNSVCQRRILEGGFFCLNSSAVALWTDGKRKTRSQEASDPTNLTEGQKLDNTPLHHSSEEKLSILSLAIF